MTNGDPFRFCIIYQQRTGSLVYLRIHERRVDGDMHDTSRYGPLVMELENYQEFVALLELGARAANVHIKYIEWDPFKEPSKEPSNDRESPITLLESGRKEIPQAPLDPSSSSREEVYGDTVDQGPYQGTA